MSSKALSRKTNGCSNKVWLENIAFFSSIVSALKFLVYLYNAYFHQSELKNDFCTIIIMNYLFTTTLFGTILQFLIYFYLGKIPSPVGYRKCAIFNTILSVLMIAVMINPIILKCHSEMDESHSKIISFLLCLHYATIPIVLCPCAYVSLILWRMSKVEPDYDGDEPYLVIYGDEGSETKKLLDDFE